MLVLLVRHAKSDYDWEKWPSDSIRPLSDKGINRQHKVAKGMVHEKLKFNEVWVSPYTRAQETLEIIQQYQGSDVLVKINKELTPFGDSDDIVSQLKNYRIENEEKTILLVGHNPNMSNLLDLLSEDGNIQEMNTSDVALCEINENGSKLVKFYPRKTLYVE